MKRQLIHRRHSAQWTNKKMFSHSSDLKDTDWNNVEVVVFTLTKKAKENY